MILAAVMLVSLAACGGKTPESDGSADGAAYADIKIGFIFLHDENSTYDKNFIDAAKRAKEALGLKDDQVVIKVDIDESAECYDTACELAEDGCNIIFADSFGHEDYMIQAAKEYPEVQFCHATGTKAHTENLANYHNAFASIYEGRFLAGVVAGLKLKEMGETKMGYVGAKPYAEVKSGLTSFFLGAKSIVPEATMEVIFTDTWYDEGLEKEAAVTLISRGAKLVSQHADSMGAPSACEAAGVPNVAYNGSTIAACPNTALISSFIDWQPYFELIVKSVAEGKAIPADYCGTIETGSVKLTALNTEVAAEGTQAKLDEVMKGLKDGTIKVFATDTYTVKGAAQTSYMADVDSDAAFTPDTEVIKDGYFAESEFRSAPYFDVEIDGITYLSK
ncbi:MAG: BMP family ABC transporter substrate-binding protein [Clostridia bacterium]|nr:BMP family ABC transporter substrate-binding protein [Clostridia bacterium]